MRNNIQGSRFYLFGDTMTNKERGRCEMLKALGWIVGAIVGLALISFGLYILAWYLGIFSTF